jgi:transcription termination/antitermination protein NusA
MDSNELLRIVDAIHRDKNIDKEIVFAGIEAALVSAAKKHYGELEEVVVTIDRQNGAINGTHNGVVMEASEMAERIGAQTAKQVMIQKIREAERDALFDEYEELRGQLVTGIIQRYDGGAATVALTNVEAILPKGEQIPGEAHHANERVRATVYEVKKAGSRVKVILSRTKPHLVQRLFEQEIPEIAEGVIEIRAIAREPGYRTKVAVSSTDQRVDSVGACVGVRGNRIKNIVDELSGERIDIVRYSDNMQVLIPNALQPAEVEEVILCQMLGRAIVLVQEDQLSLAIGRRGQNVRLASKLCGWDIEIMTREELEEQIEQAVGGYSSLEGVEPELAERLVGEGFLSYDDLSVIEPDALAEMGGLTPEQVAHIVEQAEAKATEAERVAAAQRREQRERERMEAAEAAEAAASPSAYYADGKPAEMIEQAAPGSAVAESAPSAPQGADGEAAAAPAESPTETSDDAPQ